MALIPHVLTQLPDGRMINQRTGEVFDGDPGRGDGTFIFVSCRPKLTGWFMIFQESLKELAKDRELWGQPMAILYFLLGEMDFENRIVIQQTEVAKQLGIDKHQTSKSIKKLVDKGVLLKDQKVGRTVIYRLNTDYGWKGKVVNLKNARKRQFELIIGGLLDNSEEKSASPE